MLHRCNVIILMSFILLGCVANGSYKAESLQHIKSKHADMVESYKYGVKSEQSYSEVAKESIEEAGESVHEGMGDYYLLAIGIDRYKNLPNLRTASGDARSVASVLKEKYGFKVSVLLNPTRAEILKSIERYRKMLRPSSNLVIYFAGHGWLDQQAQQGYWLPSDAHIDSSVNWVAADTITSSIRAMQAKHVLIISDSCYSGTLTRGIVIKSQEPDRIQKLAKKKARIVLSSGGIEPVVDSFAGSKNSVFCKALLDTLNINNGVLEGVDLYSMVRKKVTTQSEQIPEYGDIRNSGHDGGDFLFIPVSPPQ
ncbi:caspase family protein [uncultured Trichococcus sp.]|uniref:caspase family protein n=1 Tax=uncultured Trichococcus sp. TaxID=189665 RepID=UPI0029C689F6|nr:caspase family protein [uncultured Trichococcus sp.]